jgi:hypothetical protein
MGRYEISGIGLPIGDEEISLVKMFDGESSNICGLLGKAGAESTEYYLANGPLSHHPDDRDQSDDNAIADFRLESGRQYPPVYRIKIVIDVEELSEAETEAAWKAQQEAPWGRFDEGYK